MTGGRSSTYQMPYGLLSFSDAELANPAVCKPVLFSQGNGRGASIYAPIPRKPCASIWHFLAIRPNLHSSVSVYNMVSKTMPKGASTVEGRGTLPPPALQQDTHSCSKQTPASLNITLGWQPVLIVDVNKASSRSSTLWEGVVIL